MYENFENEINNEETQSQISQEQPVTEEEQYSEHDFSAEQIYIPPVTDSDVSRCNKGLKIFCIVMAAVILLSGCFLGGYFLGKNPKTSNVTISDYPELNLQSKPQNSNVATSSELYSSLSPSVVGILVYNEKGDMSEASGVVYSEDGYIVTNDHIYSTVPKAKFKVFTYDGNEYDAYYVAGDTRSDLAVIKISDKVSLKVSPFGNSDEVATGESVCAIGCPNGYSAKSTITCGIVSVPKVRQSITSSYSSNFIQTDTAINPGNSGGALINMYGQIVGITSSKIAATSYEGVGYAIPSKTVKRVVSSLIESGNVKNRARLGISYVFYNSAMAGINDMSSHGLLVAEVTSDSSLYGKLKKDDIITRVNDIEINDDAIILDILEELRPGEYITLTVLKQSGSVENVSALLLNDEGSSSYINSDTSGSGGDFNFPVG